MSMSLGNLSDRMLVPKYLMTQYLKLVDVYDQEWQPLFMRMMPKKVAEGKGAKDHWTRPRMADPQMMAKFYDPMERIEPMNYPHVRQWTYNTRMMANAFQRDKKTFDADFKGGIIERAHAMLLENLTKSINRGLEYTLSRFAFGDNLVMQRFTDQDLNRQGRVSLQQRFSNFATGADAVDTNLGGQSWDNFTPGTPPVFEDLAYLIERYEYMAGESPTFLTIGRKTALALELNDDLLDRLIRVKDTTQGVLGASIQGVKLTKVVGQTYKEIPGINTGAEGYPGKGDYLEMDWTHQNKIDIMTEMIGANRVEWGILGNRVGGEVACGWVDEDHEARGTPTNIFIEQWEEMNPKQVWTTAKLMVCPEIYDYARIMLVKQLATQ